jgi:hypothetical protein
MAGHSDTLGCPWLLPYEILYKPGCATTVESPTSHQARMAKGIHGLPKVSPGPAMPNPSKPWYGRFGGGPPSGDLRLSSTPFTEMNFRMLVPSHPPLRHNILSFVIPNFLSCCVAMPPNGTTSGSVEIKFYFLLLFRYPLTAQQEEIKFDFNTARCCHIKGP